MMQNLSATVKETFITEISKDLAISGLDIESSFMPALSFKIFLWLRKIGCREIAFNDTDLAYFPLMAKSLGLLNTKIFLSDKTKRTIPALDMPNSERTIFEQVLLHNKSIWLSELASSANRQVKLSVIIPHRNRSQFLSDALRGFDKQTISDFEVVIVDDASHQSEISNVEELLTRNHPFKIQLLKATRPMGARAARNWGASVAHGNYLVFFDDDNVPFPDAIETLSSMAATMPFDVLVMPYLRTFNREFSSSSWQPTAGDRVWLPLGTGFPLSALQNTLGDMNFMISKYDFSSLRGLDTSDLLTCEDWQFLFKAEQIGIKIGVCPIPTQMYFDHPNSFFKRIPRLLSELSAVNSGTLSIRRVELARLALSKNESNITTNATTYCSSKPGKVGFSLSCQSVAENVTLRIGAGAPSILHVETVCDDGSVPFEIYVKKGLYTYDVLLPPATCDFFLHFPSGLFYVDGLNLQVQRT